MHRSLFLWWNMRLLILDNFLSVIQLFQYFSHFKILLYGFYALEKYKCSRMKQVFEEFIKDLQHINCGTPSKVFPMVYIVPSI